MKRKERKRRYGYDDELRILDRYMAGDEIDMNSKWILDIADRSWYLNTSAMRSMRIEMK